MMITLFVLRHPWCSGGKYKGIETRQPLFLAGSHNQSCCGEVEAILNRTSCEVKTEGWASERREHLKLPIQSFILSQNFILSLDHLQFINCKIASSNTFRLEAHAGIFWLLKYEGHFWSLCTVTVWQKVDFLISNAR